jgi:hypothetical protein
LAAVFILQGSEFKSPPVRDLQLLRQMFAKSAFISYDLQEYYLAKIFFFILLAVVIYCVTWKIIHRRLSQWDGLVFVVASLTFLYFNSPNFVRGDGYVNDRINLYILLTLIVWLSSASYDWLAKVMIQGTIALIAIIFISFHIAKYAQINSYLKEYVSVADSIDSNTTLLPFCFSSPEYGPDGEILSLRINPFLHAAGYIVAQRQIVELDNISGYVTHAPLSYRPDLAPNLYIGVNSGPIYESKPKHIDFATYSQHAPGKVDYVLLWDIGKKKIEDGITQAIFSQLSEGYELIYVSKPRGLAQLYRRKEYKN